jgi:heme oxygenase
MAAGRMKGFMWWLSKREKLRRDALGIALAAHEGTQISAAFLIQEAQRIAAYIEKGDEFLAKDKNRD